MWEFFWLCCKNLWIEICGKENRTSNEMIGILWITQTGIMYVWIVSFCEKCIVDMWFSKWNLLFILIYKC